MKKEVAWRENELTKVEAWRTEQLVAAGFPQEEAFLLGRRIDIDVYAAIGLLKNGCSVSAAIRILT